MHQLSLEPKQQKQNMGAGTTPVVTCYSILQSYARTGSTLFGGLL